MKAQVFYEKGDIRFGEAPVPAIGVDEALIRVNTACICGSDIAYFFGRSPLETKTGKGPLITGHEMSGEICEIGKRAAENRDIHIGDRVAADPVQVCGTCVYCKQGKINLCDNGKVLGVGVDGGFAEYVRVKASNVFRLPDGCDFEEGALVEPLACAMNAIRQADIKIGDFVTVIGTGAIGLMLVQLAKAAGAGSVAAVGVVDFQLKKALALGADYAFNTGDPQSPYYCDNVTEAVGDITSGLLSDKVLVPTSARAAMAQALEISGKDSAIVYFGLASPGDRIEVPALQSLLMNKTVKFSWRARYTFPDAVRAIERKKINLKELITHRYPLEKLEEALRFMDAPEGEKIKCAIKIHQ